MDDKSHESEGMDGAWAIHKKTQDTGTEIK